MEGGFYMSSRHRRYYGPGSIGSYGDETPGHRFWRHLRRFFVWALGLGTLVFTGLLAVVIYTVPKTNKVAIFNRPPVVQFLDDENKSFYESNQTKYLPIKNSQKVPQNFQDALLSVEDRNFYHETGINYGRTVKAVAHDLWRPFNHNYDLEGGSTITQQLVKLSYFSTKASDRTVWRKVQEMYLAERVNHQYPKSDILRWYANRVYFSNGIFGAKTAADYYFDKPIQQLTTPQVAMLAGMVQAPTLYDPYQHPDLTKNRRNVVLYTMYQNKKLSKKQYLADCKLPIKTGLVAMSDHKQNNNRNEQYTDYASAVVSQLNSASDNSNFMQRSLTVHTPMNRDVQNEVNQVVRHGDIKYPNNDFQVATVVIDNQTGQVIASLGSRKDSNVLGFNRSVQMRRSSGSSIKPLLDYASYFETRHAAAGDTIKDSPYQYPGTNNWLHDWDNKYQGTETLQRALVESRNIPAVKLLQEVGLDKGLDVAHLLGFSVAKLYYSNAIGLNVSPVQLASAYTSLANGGVRSNPRFVNSLTMDGRSLKANTIQETVFSPQTAYVVTDMLKGVFSGRGTATEAKVPGAIEAGKTGTTNVAENKGMPSDALSDAWMVGYTNQYTVVVWTGYDNPNNPNEYLKNSEQTISQQIYKEIMSYLWNMPGTDHSDFNRPDGVTNTRDGLSMDGQSDLNHQFTSNVNQSLWTQGFDSDQNVKEFFKK